jgi:hypothetical protein
MPIYAGAGTVGRVYVDSGRGKPRWSAHLCLYADLSLYANTPLCPMPIYAPMPHMPIRPYALCPYMPICPRFMPVCPIPARPMPIGADWCRLILDHA